MPAVSIGMPVYNGERFLPEALASLLSQTHSDFELIISDNASTDRTGSIVLDAASRDSRVRYHRNPTNVGAAPNFNLVLERARGNLFMWAACDDLWHPEYIESLVLLLHESPEAVLAFCDFDNIDTAGRSVKENPHLFELPAEDMAHRLHAYLLQPEDQGKANLIYGLMRRPSILRAGGMKRWGETDWGEDMLVVFRLLSLGQLRLCRNRMFHKRLTDSPAQADRGTVVTRLKTWRTDLRDRRSYFEGYARLIDMAEGLTQSQKAALHALARNRYREIRRSELRTLRRNARRKISRTVWRK